MERGTMFCIFHPWSLNVYIYAEKTMKQLLRLSTEDKTCERLSSGRCHIHAQVYTCHQAWRCILRAQEIGYSGFSSPFGPFQVYYLLPILPYLLLTSLQPVFTSPGLPKDWKLLLIKCNISHNTKEHDIYRQQVMKTTHQTHRVPPLQPCKDPSKIIFSALWSGLPELPDLLWYQQDKEQEIRFPSTLSSCWNHAAVEPGTRTPHP